MAESHEKTHWRNHHRNQRSAEEVVGSVVDNILTEGGHILWHKYLERKAFAFAAERSRDLLVSHLKMCFVSHDQGEDNLEDDWTLEEEPAPAGIDSWARMHVLVRRKPRENPADANAAGGGRGKGARRGQSRVSDLKRGKAGGRGAQADSRSFSIADAVVVDEEEEGLRDQKGQEERKKKDMETKDREADRQREEHQRIVDARLREMAERPHTFDSDGNLIWIQEIDVNKLPKVQESFTFVVKRDPKQKEMEQSQKQATMAANAASREKPKDRRGRGRDRGAGDHREPEFTDGFSKLQHGQPPILETMHVRPGVILESSGKNRAGPALEAASSGNKQMSRKDYLALAEKEVSAGADFAQMAQETDSRPGAPPSEGAADAGGTGSIAGGQGSVARTSERSLPEESAGGESHRGPAGGSESKLPPIGKTPTRGGSAPRRTKGGPPLGSTGAGMPSHDSLEDGKRLQPAPVPPNPSYRAKRFEALGMMAYEPPRYHKPRLGGQPAFGRAPQPPLGATMGHGLVRSGSEAFYFPENGALPHPALIRNASDGSLPRLWSGGGGTPSGRPSSRGGEDEARAGKIVGDPKSSVFRSLKQMLN